MLFEGFRVPGELRIGIVEDDESLRVALEGLLRSLGYEAEGFGSAEGYLDRLDPKPHACLITDLHLPHLSGIDLACRLRDNGQRVPVIMITARSEPRLEQQALASGATCLLRKPFEAASLVECLRRALAIGRM